MRWIAGGLCTADGGAGELSPVRGTAFDYPIGMNPQGPKPGLRGHLNLVTQIKRTSDFGWFCRIRLSHWSIRILGRIGRFP